MMKHLLLTNLVFFFTWNVLAIEASQVRVIPSNKIVTIEIDGQFPAGPATDVLFVVDDSGSMQTHQENLAKHIDLLAEQAIDTNNDFHIGIVNTLFEGSSTWPNNTKVGELLGTPKILDSQTPNLINVLKKNLTLGTQGSGTESIFQPVMTALSPENTQGMNAGFLREEAHLSIVVLTDAEDQSKFSAWDFADYLVDLKGGPENVSMQGIVVSVADHQAKTCQGEDAPKKIEEAIRLLSGKTYSLCSTTMAQDIEALAQDVFPPFQGIFKPAIKFDFVELVGKPVLGSIKVKFGKQTLEEDPALGWSYDETANRVVFGNKIEWQPQSNRTRVVVTYKPE